MTAFQYIQSGELKKAKQILQVLPEPDVFNKHVLLADVSLKQGDMEDASSIYEKMAEETRMSDKLLTLLLSMLESDPAYDFLRNEKEFDRLLEKYRRYIDR